MLKKISALALVCSFFAGSGFCSTDSADVNINADTIKKVDSIKIEQKAEIPDDEKIGGSGVFEFGLTRLNLDAVEKIVKDEIKNGNFDFDENIFTTIGFTGYAGQRKNGMRIGFGVWGGYNALLSDKWTTRATPAEISRGSDTLIDSVIKLHIMFAHAGLIVEKSFKVTNNLNLYAGGMLGGGLLMAVEDRRSGSGAFSKTDENYDEWDSDTVDNCDDRVAVAPLYAFDIRAGFTYSISRWFHIGLDGSSLFYYSQSGFQSKFGSFWSANPGVKLRFVFGTSA